MKLSEVSVSRPVFATMMVGALLVLGLFSYLQLGVQLFPDIDFPFVVVQTVYPGAAAEAVETEITVPIEDVINEVSGVRHVQSQSQEGYSLLVIEFELEKEGFEAAQQVREKVASIRSELPEDAEDPFVLQYDPGAEAIMSISISGRRPLKEVTQVVKDVIRPRLETIRGVGEVELVGGYEREILIALDPIQMEGHGITVNDVSGAVSAANLEIPGGRVDEASREYIVRVTGRLPRAEQFEDVIVQNQGGTPIYLRDIARVIDTVVEQRSLARLNGNISVSLNIKKQSGANLVELANEARKVIDGLGGELPPDIEIEIVQDNSTFIQDSIHEIIFNIEFGTILAIVVIFLFLLDLRPTLITGFSIPISIIATFTLMRFLGFSINMMTLLGLSLAVGILVDDAIVVIENIYRHLDQGQSPMEAALSGTKEIGLAVMATTFAIVVVFLPVAFMEGIVGRFFYQFGMSVAFAVLISLFVAFSLTPMLSSRWLKKIDHAARNRGHQPGIWGSVVYVFKLWNRFFDGLRPVYVSLLGASLRHRWIVSLVAIVSFVGAMALVPFVGTEFMTETDEGRLVVSAVTPPGTSLEGTSKRMEEIEHRIRANILEVTDIFTTIGSGNGSVTDGQALVKLTDMRTRVMSAKQYMDSVRTLLQDLPGVKVAVGRGGHEGGSEKPVEVSIRGDNLDLLTQLTHRVQRIVYNTPGTVDVDNTLEEGKPEIQIHVDRKAADDLGVNLAMVPMTVRTLIEGDVVTRFKEGDEEYDVRIRLDEQYRQSSEDVGRILVESDKKVSGRDPFLVPLARFAAMEKTENIGRYNRYDRQREVRVNANVASGAFAGTVSGLVLEEASSIELPPGYSIGAVGTAEIMTESFINILMALALSIVFIYLVLASQYESFSDPFSIMFSLPLALIGAVVALLVSSSAFSIMSLIGVVLLMGLVTKNAILLIDFVKQERAKGVDRMTAILTAGPIRLRPILMTTFATVFGMLPLALGIGPGAELRAPMARAVIGGMISSTVLTLVVVPVIYTIIDDFVGLFRKKADIVR